MNRLLVLLYAPLTIPLWWVAQRTYDAMLVTVPEHLIEAYFPEEEAA